MCYCEKPRTLAVLTFLRETPVGRMIPSAPREEWKGEEIVSEVCREGRRRGAGPAVECTFPSSYLC